MQTITVKYLPATETRGSRLKASATRGSITIPYPHELNRSEAHAHACRNLAKFFLDADKVRYGSDPKSSPWNGPWVEGSLPGDAESVFVSLRHNTPFHIL